MFSFTQNQTNENGFYFCFRLILVANNQPRKIGSVADIDPVNGVYGSVEHSTYMQQAQQQQNARHIQQQQQQSLQSNHQSQNAQSKSMQKTMSSKLVREFLFFFYPDIESDLCSFLLFLFLFLESFSCIV